MIDSITLLGSSSGRNAGDAALLSSIMDSVDEACDSRLLYEIPSMNPNFVWRTYHNRVRPLSIMPWNASLKLLGLPTYRSLLRTDLSLIFDMTLFDRSLYNPMFNFMSSYAALLPAAKRKGKKMGCYTCTVGPVTTVKGRDMLRRILEMMDFITVRDQDSIDLMRECGVQNPNVLITNDAALTTMPAPKTRVDEIITRIGLFGSTKEILAFNVNPYFDTWAGHDGQSLDKEQFVATYVAGVRDAVKDIDADLLFVSTQHMDEPLTREIMARLQLPHRKALLSNREYSHYDIRGVMERVSLLFAMRLHCLILTSAGGTPIIALNYLPKVRTYLKSLGLEDQGLSFEQFSQRTITEHIRMGWSDRAQIRTTLNQKMPRMQQEAKKAAQLVLALRNGEDIARTIARLREVVSAAPRQVNAG